ncbi:MAG TPA: hypothetical protein H9870_14365 [Candidatus Corynebacterium avicola]|uniref:Uncharacterized protein n=1 Tax=Candidatus Corynebacterium avicola TaxID=2838527 RepID=A0A9D1ULY9_9CORY|nr:hypothetical protein [Candidatus Corynebacterium avicola]
MSDVLTWTARQSIKGKPLLFHVAGAVLLLLVNLLFSPSFVLIGATILVVAIALSETSWWLSVGPYGFHYRFLYGFPRRTVPCSEITSVKVVKVNTWNWGGWGRHSNMDGTGLVTGRGPGIRITRTNGKIIEASCRDEDEAATAVAVLETHLNR